MSKEAIQLSIGAGGLAVAAVGAPAIAVGVGAAVAVAAVGIGVYNLYSSRSRADGTLPPVPDLGDISWMDLSIAEQVSTSNQQINLLTSGTTDILIIPNAEESSQVIIWQE
jgi:hypothetical protein